MISWLTRGAKGRTAVLTLFAAAAVCGTAVAAITPVKDAKFGVYTRWGADKVNIKLDKVEHVMHVDSRVYASGKNPSTDSGYNIYEFTVQNAGAAGGVREPAITAIYDDESQIDTDYLGPYLGTGLTHFNGRLEHLQTVHIRWVQFKVPVDHKLTKLILDPNDGGPKLRYTVKDANVGLLPDVPAASPTP